MGEKQIFLFRLLFCKLVTIFCVYQNLFLTQNNTALKKFTFLAFTAVFFLSFSNSFAQQRTQPINPHGSRLHCATMEALEMWYQQNPQIDRHQIRYAPEPANITARTNVVVTIPIVFHIVGNSTRLAQVTDADVLWQLNKLNEDFRGANPDSTNATGF